MMGITGVCLRLIGELAQALRGARSDPAHSDPKPICEKADASEVDELMVRALTAVFGMENNGKIKKEKARRVVENLGLIYSESEEERSKVDEGNDEMGLEEVVGGLMEADGSKRSELLREAFKIFDEDGNGFIEAMELKRVLECLGLMDKGWDMGEIQKMLHVVDLNLDGKVDFGEFELMMMG
ncbi:calmodulin-like protein 3 [Carica papaya]|nr:calmodulin-like protein 3 [Carica papaya]